MTKEEALQSFLDRWDPEEFDWEFLSGWLARWCSEVFDHWWDPERFNWRYSDDLARYCKRHFHKWWEPSHIALDVTAVEKLIDCCEQYCDKWLPVVLNKVRTIAKVAAFVLDRVDDVRRTLLKETLQRR